MLESQDRFKAETHIVFIEKVSKIALNRNDDAKLHTFDEIASYPHSSNPQYKIKTELVAYLKKLI